MDTYNEHNPDAPWNEKEMIQEEELTLLEDIRSGLLELRTYAIAADNVFLEKRINKLIDKTF